MKLCYKWFRNFLGVVAGNALLAYGVAAFYIPTQLAMGGSTGVGVILYHLFGFDTAVSVFIINAFLLIGGWLCVGKEFVISTTLGPFIYPIFWGIFQKLPTPDIITTDKLAGTICAAALVGAGVGLTLRAGASTGGSDTAAMICNKAFHLPITPIKLIVDYGVMALTFLIVSSDNLIYSVLALVVETIVMNQMLVAGATQMQLFIISPLHERIREALTKEQETGVTLLRAETGWQRESSEVVLCVIPRKKLYAVKEAVHNIDPAAFITVSEVKEVQGQGFSYERIPLPAGK